MTPQTSVESHTLTFSDTESIQAFYYQVEFECFDKDGFDENLNQWNDVVYCRNFYRLKEKDIIKVYLWNPEKSLFEIGNISLAFYD